MKRPKFPLNLPVRLAEKIEKNRWDDPILRQFLPTVEEERVQKGFGCNPVGDDDSRKAPKLLHKYLGRLLLMPTSACAMHCRYCFRQHFDYETLDRSVENEIELIRNDPTVEEVILSGGDPLSLPNETLEQIFLQLRSIPHIKRLRFHTRFPMGIPERIDEGFLKLIQECPWSVWFVIHSNHPKEFDAEILSRLKALRQHGAQLLCQSVLLKGVNDSADVLESLCRILVNNGILPYYLHQLDRVKGAGHFEVEEEDGVRLIEAVNARLPGYAVPKYVREDAGEPNKTTLHLLDSFNP